MGETTRALAEAQAAVAEAQAAEAVQLAMVEQRRRECVAAVAAGLPNRLDAFLKSVAQSDMQATNALGREGIWALRHVLREAASQLGNDFQAAAGKLQWDTSLPTIPTPATDSRGNPAMPRYGDPQTRGAAVIIENFLSRGVAGLIDILKRHGFKTFSPTPQLTTSTLFDEKHSTVVALNEAHKALVNARSAILRAKAAYDEVNFEFIWGPAELPRPNSS